MIWSTLSSSQTVYLTKVTTTTITIPAITTDVVSIWNVYWNSTTDTIVLTTSILGPNVTLTEGSDVVTQTRMSTTTTTTLAGIIVTYAPEPYPPVQNTKPTPVTQYHVTKGPPDECTRNCGSPCKGPHCTRSGGDDDDGHGCRGPFCTKGPGPGEGGNDGDCKEGEEPQLASSCDITCYSIATPTPTEDCETYCETTTTCGKPENTATTTTVGTGFIIFPTEYFDSFDALVNDPAGIAVVESGVASQASVDAQDPYETCSHQSSDKNHPTPYCVCSSSTFSESVDSSTTPANSCAYMTLPPTAFDPSPTTITVTATPPPGTVGGGDPGGSTTITDTAKCEACTHHGGAVECNTIPGCTTPTSTVSVKPVPTPSQCLVQFYSIWDYGGGGPGQAPIDDSSYYLTVVGPYNGTLGDEVYEKTLDPSSTHYQVEAKCGIVGCEDEDPKSSIHTEAHFDLLYRGWKDCFAYWLGKTYTGKTRSKIDTNYVSRTYYWCEVYFDCLPPISNP